MTLVVSASSAKHASCRSGYAAATVELAGGRILVILRRSEKKGRSETMIELVTVPYCTDSVFDDPRL